MRFRDAILPDPGHCDEYENYKQQCKRKATESDQRDTLKNLTYTNCEDGYKIQFGNNSSITWNIT